MLSGFLKQCSVFPITMLIRVGPNCRKIVFVTNKRKSLCALTETHVTCWTNNRKIVFVTNKRKSLCALTETHVTWWTNNRKIVFVTYKRKSPPYRDTCDMFNAAKRSFFVGSTLVSLCHRRRINTEEQAEVVAAVWGNSVYSIPCLPSYFALGRY